MSDLRFFVEGTEAEMSAFENFCSQQRIQTKKFVTAANSVEVVAAVLTGLTIIAKYEVISKCIIAFRSTRTPPPSIEYFVADVGWKKIEAPTVEELLKIMRETDSITFTPPDEPLRQEEPKREIGFHVRE